MDFHRSPIALATKIFMLYKKDLNRLFLIVEGITDYNLWTDNFSHKISNKVKIEFSGSKDVSIETLKIIYEEFSKEIEIQGVIAIVDADFDHLTNQELFSHHCLFRTDYHDIDLMMLSSKCFIKFYNRFCTEKERLMYCLKKFYRKDIKYEDLPHFFLKAILDNVEKIGILRWINYINDFQLSFRDLNYYYILDEELFTIDRDKLIIHLITKNHRDRNFKKNIEELYKKESNKTLDKFQICQGHDAFSLLTIWINNLFCKRDAFSFLQSNDINMFFESSFEYRFFKKFKIYQDLKLWGENNPNFKIFK